LIVEPTQEPIDNDIRIVQPTFKPSQEPTHKPTPLEWDVCAETDQDLEIEGAEILINNLGNLGPENSVEGVLRYFDVVKNAPGGQQIDLIVSVAPSSDYDVADNSYNGKWEEFA